MLTSIFGLIRLKSKVPQTRYHAKTKKSFFYFCIFGHHFWPSRFLPIFACRGGPGSAAPAAGRGPPRHAKIDFRLNLSRKYFGSENLTKTLRKPRDNLRKPRENLPKTSWKPPGNLAKTSRTPWESCGTNAPTVPYFST